MSLFNIVLMLLQSKQKAEEVLQQIVALEEELNQLGIEIRAVTDTSSNPEVINATNAVGNAMTNVGHARDNMVAYVLAVENYIKSIS